MSSRDGALAADDLQHAQLAAKPPFKPRRAELSPMLNSSNSAPCKGPGQITGKSDRLCPMRLKARA